MRLLGRRVFFCALVASLALSARTASGQDVRGVVLDRADAPIAGAIVMLLDARAIVTARALTNESGEFRIAPAQPGRYRIRTIRIGFRPATTEAFALRAGESVTRRIALDDIPLTLDTVTIASTSSCSIRADTAAATFRVWEQVRAALTAAQLTAGNRALDVRFISYSRTLEPGRRGRVVRQFARVKEGQTTKPFRSIAADSLSRAGYVNFDETGTTYHAPDIEILLSDGFIDEHCLTISPESDTLSLAIAFAPTRARRYLPEIAGTVTVDRRTSELRGLRFGYVNLDRSQSAGDPGGGMDFVRLRNGAWMISRWHIRMPVTDVRSTLSTVGVPGPGAERYVLREVRVDGAELTWVRRRGDTLWARAPLTLAGVVRESVSGVPVANAIVELRGTGQSDTTNASGRFEIADMLAGEYLVDVRTPSLMRVGAAHTVPFVLMDGTTSFTARVPSAEQLLARECRDLEPRTGVAAGVVRIAGDSILPRNVRVVAEWKQFFVHSAEIFEQRRTSEARTDTAGAFRLCGVPENTPLSLRAEMDSATAEPLALRMEPGARFLTAEIVLVPIGFSAMVTGTVVGKDSGAPIPGVEVQVSGRERSVFTDSAGRFQLTLVPPGRHDLTARRVGYAPTTIVVTLRRGEHLQQTIELATVQTLEPVEVQRTALIPSFEENRRIGQGHFITRAELAKAGGRKMSEVLATVPGLGLVRGSSRAWVYSKRTRAATRGRPAMADAADANSGARQDVCYSHVYVDNVQVYGASPKTSPQSQQVPEPLFDVNSIPPDQIEAIEFYATPAQTPVRYARIGASCGVLIIHSRRPY